MKSIKSNFLYNSIYQLLRIILPIITVPYVSRVLGANNLGIYSFTYSIVYYFILFSLLGINNYGNRTIAKNRNNYENLSKSFFEIYIIQFFMTLLMIGLYLTYLMIFNNQYRLVALIQVIYLVATLFDVNWFFYGLEEFKLTVIRSSFIKIVSVVLIFFLVNSKNDLLIYVLIMSISTLVSELIMFIMLLKRIKYVKLSEINIVRHIKPCLILFLPVISISLYNVMDKIMLGYFSNMSEVAYYEQAEKIISIPLTLITSLGTVMMPRISNLISIGDEKQVVKHINKSMEFIMLFAFPLMFGIISISDSFISLFLGSEFKKTSILLCFLSIPIVFKSIGNITRVQYMTPHEMDKEYLYTTIIGAIINLIVNIILIPKFLSIGACVGTIIAELVVVIYMIFILRKKLPFRKYFYTCIEYFLKSLIMFLIIFPFKYLHFNTFITVLLEILVGLFIYFILNRRKIMKYIVGGF